MTNVTTGGWTVKKEISIGTVVTIILQSVAIVWFLSAMDGRITNNTTKHTELVSSINTRFAANESSVAALQATLHQEVRNIQADRSEINGRLVRIETLLTQMIEAQQRANR